MNANVLLDVATADPRWAAWSEGQLDVAALRGPLVISDIAYAEVSVGYARVEDVDAVLAATGIEVHSVPRAGLFLAGSWPARSSAPTAPAVEPARVCCRIS